MEQNRIYGIAEVIREAAKENAVLVVAGGGAIAREYIELARRFGADEASCDLIGIDATRMNARLLISALRPEGMQPRFAYTYEEAKNAMSSGIVFMGGVSPGYTTDAVAAILAEYVGADLLINATSVDGVYDSDPMTNPDARKYELLTRKELVEIVMRTDMIAGSTSIIDPVAAKIIERCGIKTVVINGNNPGNIMRALEGKHDGTEVI